MAAIDGHGAALVYGTAGGTPSTAFGEVVSIGGPNISRPMIETTHMGSTARKYIAGGFYDLGTVDVEIQYDPGNTGHDAMTSAILAGTEHSFKITWSDTSTASFDGFVESFNVTAEMEDRLTASLSIRVNGTLTLATA
jgi:hypothetical protein